MLGGIGGLGPFAECNQVVIIAHIDHPQVLHHGGADLGGVIVLLHQVAAHAFPVAVGGVIAVHAAHFHHYIELGVGAYLLHLIDVAQGIRLKVVLAVDEDHDGPLGRELCGQHGRRHLEIGHRLRHGDIGMVCRHGEYALVEIRLGGRYTSAQQYGHGGH